MVRYSLPKGARGLLERPTPLSLSKLTPAPGLYSPQNQERAKWKTLNGNKFSRATRDVHFSKYASQNSELIKKSLH